MTNWQTKTIGELVDYEQPTKYLVKDTNYMAEGTPVLTANKAFVLGYTEEGDGIYRATLDDPVIIFDDFTTDNKFVNFNFKVKSSAIKILTAKSDVVLPKFVYGAMQLIKTEITEHKRRFISEYQFNSVDVPELSEQERIVAVLEVWGEYIEKLEQKIALKEQLKKGLMQQLLTGRLRLPGFTGEWSESPLGNLTSITTGRKDVNQGNPNGMYPFFTCSRNHTYSDEYSFDTEAILIAGNGDVGHCKYYNGKFEAYQRTYVLYDFKVVSAQYVFPYLRHYFQSFIETQKQMGAMPFIKVGMLRDFKIKLPTNKDEQDAIAEVVMTADDEVKKMRDKLETVRAQKKYLLKNLITGTIRTPENLLKTPIEKEVTHA